MLRWIVLATVFLGLLIVVTGFAGTFSRRSMGIRAAKSEARILLGGIRVSQEAFRATEEGYVSTETEPILPSDKKARMRRRSWDHHPCSPKCRRGNIAACRTFDCIGFTPPSGVARYSYECNAAVVDEQPEFTCVAVGDLDGDGDPSAYVFGTNHRGGRAIVAPIPELAKGLGCENAAANEVEDCRPASL